MPSLVEKLPHYSVKQLPCTCSMFEIGDFSTMHSLKYSIEYHDNTFLPPSSTGLYCATFVKDDPKSDKAYEVRETWCLFVFLKSGRDSLHTV